MPPSSSTQDLAQAMAALQKSLSILILYYKGYIKCILLVVFVYVFYKMGNLSVKDERLQQKQQLSQLIERRIAVRVEIPKKLIKLRKITNVVLIVVAFLLILLAIAYYMRIKLIKRNFAFILTLILGSSIILLSLIHFYKYFLNKKFRQNESLQRNISKNLAQFQTIIGPKANKLLKHHLCKQQISKLHTSFYSLECSKPDCKQLRTLCRTRIQTVETLVNDVMNFEWCSICKRRKSFDEYLAFQYKEYQERGQDQEEQVKYKMAYLLQGIDKIHRWLSITSPCNCSKLYWVMSTQKILHYKKSIKNTDTRIKLLQDKHPY